MYLPRHSDALRKRHTLYAPPKELPLDSDGLFKPLMVLLHQMQPCDLTFCPRAIAQAMKFQSVGVQKSRGFMFAKDRGSRAPIA